MINLFKTETLTSLFAQVEDSATSKAQNLEKRYFHDDSIKNVIASITKDLLVNEISVDFSSRIVAVKMVPSGYGPNDKVARVDYTFAFSGNSRLLGVQPSKRTFQYDIEAEVLHFTFRISYRTRYVSENLSDQVKKDVKSAMAPIIDELPNMIDAINKEIRTLNSQIFDLIDKAIKDRKAHFDQIEKQNNELNDL